MPAISPVAEEKNRASYQLRLIHQALDQEAEECAKVAEIASDGFRLSSISNQDIFGRGWEEGAAYAARLIRERIRARSISPAQP